MKNPEHTHKVTLTHTAYTLDQLPRIDAPQVALAGRSNVGKSSLVNTLSGRKQLAKTSSTPGKTRSINFYLVEPGGYYLVDLPGYGYARCSKAERAKWAELIESYFRRAATLRATVVLMDCRLDPQQLDMEMTGYLRQTGVPVIAVLTKADKCKQREQALRQNQWREILRTDNAPITFSSKTGRGSVRLWQVLDRTCQWSAPGTGKPDQTESGGHSE